MKIKRRYLFPLLYVLADASSILFLSSAFAVPPLLSALSVPSNLVMGMVSRTFGGPSDPIYFGYFVGAGTILQMFLLGYIWELLVEKVHKLLNRKPAAA
jgi:hypothetical protein